MSTLNRNLISTFLFTTLLLTTSCSNKSKNDKNIIQALDESLGNSNNTLNRSSELILAAMNNNLADPARHERTSIWHPKAQYVHQLSSNVYAYIDDLKKKGSIDIQTAGELSNKLDSYKKEILNIDSSIRFEFVNSISLMQTSLDTVQNAPELVYQTYFKNTSLSASLAMLTKFQNNIKILENKVLSFCIERTASYDIVDDFYSALTSQSSTILKPGENIEITAGIGTFSARENPLIIINGNKTKLNEYGFSTAKIKVPTTPGKYKIPVKISFTNQTTGKNEVQETMIEYTVSKPCDQ